MDKKDLDCEVDGKMEGSTGGAMDGMLPQQPGQEGPAPPDIAPPNPGDEDYQSFADAMRQSLRGPGP